MRTALRVLLARLRNRALELEGVDALGHRTFHLMPNGRIMPSMCGGSPEGDPEPDPTPDPEPTPDPDPDPEPDPTPGPQFEGDFDEERAKRLIANIEDRNAKKLAKAEAAAAKAQAEADKLKQAQETEQEKVVRERDEARLSAERERANTERLTIDLALRDAAAEAGVPAKKVKRVLKLADREDITVEDGEVDGATEAVAELLEDIPELAASKPDPDPDPEPEPEPAGGNPSRREKVKPLTAEQVRKMAKEDPDRFNALFDEGKIPKSALAGK